MLNAISNFKDHVPADDGRKSSNQEKQESSWADRRGNVRRIFSKGRYMNQSKVEKEFRSRWHTGPACLLCLMQGSPCVLKIK